MHRYGRGNICEKGYNYELTRLMKGIFLEVGSDPTRPDLSSALCMQPSQLHLILFVSTFQAKEEKQKVEAA